MREHSHRVVMWSNLVASQGAKELVHHVSAGPWAKLWLHMLLIDLASELRPTLVVSKCSSGLAATSRLLISPWMELLRRVWVTLMLACIKTTIHSVIQPSRFAMDWQAAATAQWLPAGQAVDVDFNLDGALDRTDLHVEFKKWVAMCTDFEQVSNF